MSEQLQITFDYGSLDLETKIKVEQRTGEIKSLVRRSAQDIIEIGGKLLEVKNMLDHGRWLPWLQAEFGWSERTARNFINVHKIFSSHPSIGDIATSALYLLSSPSAPEGAVEEAIELSQTRTVTLSDANDIIGRNGKSANFADLDEEEPQPLDLSGLTPPPPPKSGLDRLPSTGGSLSFIGSASDRHEEEEDEEPRETRATFLHETPDHYTTSTALWYAAMSTLGGVDLDPCAHPEEESQAMEAWTSDGLVRNWSGTVYCFPPIRGINSWVEKALVEYGEGRCEAILLLLPAMTWTEWFGALAAQSICFLRGLPEFGNCSGAPACGYLAAYIGEEPERFIEAFRDLGVTFQAVPK